jgi:rfaE bifunctional protein nucleotidyltransferase chain/domain
VARGPSARGPRGAQLREDGRRIVFANGCFDVLHAGHVALLQAAGRSGTSSVVGLNTDESVRRLKGPTRPVSALEDRVAVLSALAAVDVVCAFGEDTPLELILALRPDVLVKGGDYAPRTSSAARRPSRGAGASRSCRSWTAAPPRACWPAPPRGPEAARGGARAQRAPRTRTRTRALAAVSYAKPSSLRTRARKSNRAVAKVRMNR